MLKRIASRLPSHYQLELKKLHFRKQIKQGKFTADEPEYFSLSAYIGPGDIVIDVGANVGQYTRKMSQLVGHSGRVIALEPMTQTFDLLTANTSDLSNVTLLNVAASDQARMVSMELPKFDSGLSNYYRASITEKGTHHALAIPLDALDLKKVTLIKIDAEGHDLAVLQGAFDLIRKFKPTLIVEAGNDGMIEEWLVVHAGYQFSKLPGSPNLVAHPMTQPTNVKRFNVR